MKKSSGGVSFLSLLTIAFIVLRLTGHIDWSWFWVLSPLLIPVILGILIFGVFGSIYWYFKK